MAEHNSGLRNNVLARHSGSATMSPNVLKANNKNAAHSQFIKKQGILSMAVTKRKPGDTTDVSWIQNQAKTKTTYVLDTNVLMSDWSSLFRYEDHVVCIVSQVLNELDSYKNDRSSKAFNVRETSRVLRDLIVKATKQQIQDGIDLILPGKESDNPKQVGKLLLYFASPQIPEGVDLRHDKKDDRIIMACLALQEEGRQVVLVTEDLICAVKAIGCGLKVEMSANDTRVRASVEEDGVTGFHTMGDDFWVKLGDNYTSWKEKQVSCYEFNHEMFTQVYVHQFLILPNGDKLRVTERTSPHTVVAMSFSHHNHKRVLEPRNSEQEMALELLMDPDVSSVALKGPAGCGKTYLAMIAAVEQVRRGWYKGIIITRSLINADVEIGYLPGTEMEKMAPWLAGFTDNLKSWSRKNGDKKGGESLSMEALMNDLNLEMKALNFVKGSSWENLLILVDEVQDLDREKIKLIGTRVGDGSKIVFLGNTKQIDNRSVTKHTCGLSILINELSFSDLTGHITLDKCERSPLAALVEKVL